METLDATAFERGDLLREGTWVVAFLADWCPFCERFLPSFLSLEGNAGFRIAVADVSDVESPLWDELAISVVPTLIAFDDGRPIHREDGLLGRGLPAGALERTQAAALGKPG